MVSGAKIKVSKANNNNFFKVHSLWITIINEQHRKNCKHFTVDE